eukprot:UN06393
MMTAGRISESEYAAMTLPQYYNTVAEFAAPLINKSDPVHIAGLRLESIETRVVPCPFAEEFKNTVMSSDSQPTLFRRFAPGMRAPTSLGFQQTDPWVNASRSSRNFIILIGRELWLIPVNMGWA